MDTTQKLQRPVSSGQIIPLNELSYGWLQPWLQNRYMKRLPLDLEMASTEHLLADSYMAVSMPGTVPRNISMPNT